MSETGEGQNPLDKKVSRRGLFKLGTAVGVAAAAAKILPDAKPASAETPTPVSTPSPVRTPTVTPSVKELQTKTAKLFVEQTAQAEQIEEAVKYKNAAATNTAQAKKLEEAFDTRPSTSTPTPTKPPAATPLSTPTVTPTFTDEQIAGKQRVGLLPTYTPTPTSTRPPSGPAKPASSESDTERSGSQGESFLWTIGKVVGEVVLAAAGTLGIMKLIPIGKNFIKGYSEPGGGATGEADGTGDTTPH